jgi:hypothetical protein
MKRIRLWVHVFAVVLLAGTGGASQLPAIDDVARRLTAGLIEPLGLTEDQTPLVEKALAELVQHQREIIARYAAQEGPLDQPSMRELQTATLEAQRQTREQLAGVLDEAQLRAFDEVMPAQRARVGGEAIVSRLDGPLELTTDQRHRLIPIFTDNLLARSEALEQIRSEGRSFGSMRGLRDTMKEHREALEAGVESVLTPEQMETYRELAEKARDEMRQRSRGRGSR